jgi:antitoxin component YwqK of YwqJK toxin-antitoxin module
MVEISGLTNNFDINGNYNLDAKSVDIQGAKSINIGELLSKIKTNSGKQNATQVSKQEYTYNGYKGFLTKFDDGSYAFLTKIGNNSFVLKFPNGKAVKNKRPSSKTAYPNGDKKKAIHSKYKYYMNGERASEETYDANGKLLSKTKFDKQGKLNSQIIYDKNGKIDKQIIYEFDGNKTRTDKTYDAKKQLISTGVNQYDENGKIKTRDEYYPDGKTMSKTEYWDNGVIKEQRKYDKDGNLTGKITAEIDGNFESSRQVGEGDCYLMSTINSIRQTKDGQQILKDLVKVSTNENGEKVYTVTLPGAKIAAEGLKTDDRIKNGTIAITGTYTFTESEMQEILKQAGKKYSIGDGDVILLEAAFEKYRGEVESTLKANNINPKTSFIGEAGLQTGRMSDNILAGGRAEDANFILTGKKSNSLYNNSNIQYGLNYSALQNGEIEPEHISRAKGLGVKAVAEVDETTTSKAKLNKMLDTLMKDPNDGEINFVACAGFTTVENGKIVGGHELTITKVTKDTVTLINPWYPDKEITMSREDFLNTASTVNISDMRREQATTDTTEPSQTQNPTTTQPTTTHPTTTNPTTTPTAGNAYKVPQGKGYTTMIVEALIQQGIKPTKENIKKAKAQFEKANPGAVKTYNRPGHKYNGNQYLLANAEVKIPQFEM